MNEYKFQQGTWIVSITQQLSGFVVGYKQDGKLVVELNRTHELYETDEEDWFVWGDEE